MADADPPLSTFAIRIFSSYTYIMNRDIKNCKSDCNKQFGFSLLEVVIALAIISVGVLGMMTLQINGGRLANEVAHTTVANMLLQDMAGRIQANAVEAAKGLNSNYQKEGNKSQATNPNCFSATNACTSADIAINDIAEWQQNVSAALPGSTAVVCMDTNPNTDPTVSASTCTAPSTNPSVISFTIKIRWTEKNDPKKIMTTAMVPAATL